MLFKSDRRDLLLLLFPSSQDTSFNMEIICSLHIIRFKGLYYSKKQEDPLLTKCVVSHTHLLSTLCCITHKICYKSNNGHPFGQFFSPLRCLPVKLTFGCFSFLFGRGAGGVCMFAICLLTLDLGG